MTYSIAYVFSFSLVAFTVVVKKNKYLCSDKNKIR